MILPQRRRIRLETYDYSTPGAYFVTVCTKDKQNLLGNIVKGEPSLERATCRLSRIGELVREEILQMEHHYTNVTVDKYVIMPNHIHLIIRITERINPFPTRYDIPNVVGKLKAAVTRRVGKAFMPSVPKTLWQRSYYDHVIRSQQDYNDIWKYIDTNPDKWQEDRFYQ